MAARSIKARKTEEQNGVCALTGEALAPEPWRNDKERFRAKMDGGTYTEENTRVVEPVAHLERHGNLRLRPEALAELKAVVDDREQVMKLKLKVDNQLRAYERRVDHLSPETRTFLAEQAAQLEVVLRDRTHRVERWVKAHRAEDPLVNATMDVPNLGPITTAYLTAYVDLAGVFPEKDADGKPHPRAGQELARCASSLWKYAGLHASSQDRYTKGEKSGGNKALRCILWNAACCMVRDPTSPYREVYDRTKARLAASERVTQTRNTQGHLVEKAWRDVKPGHRHGAALRAVMKHILSDYWFTGRTLLGLSTRPLYVEEKLGHTGIVSPRERGWRF